MHSSSSSAIGNCSFIPGIKPLESPGVTPIKPLPFSPSQFLNSPSINLNFDSKIPASTPVRKYNNQKNNEEDVLVTPKQTLRKMSKELFPHEVQEIVIKTENMNDEDAKPTMNTPNAKSVLNGPRTPTPFKNALNEYRKIHPYVPSSPNGLVEDITEIMNKERQQDSTMDSVYETDSSVVVQPVHMEDEPIASMSNPKRLTYDETDSSQQQKKAKKSLESTWNTTTTDESEDFPFVETPSKALNSNSGVAFSPPSIVKDTLGDSGMLLDTDMTITNNSPNASPSQVHNTIKRNENKIMMHQNNGNMQHQQRQQSNQHYHQNDLSLQKQENRCTQLKPIHNFNSISQLNSVQSSLISSEKVYNRKIQRSLSTITLPTDENGAKVNQPLLQFNPYADENDGSNRFQLSKSINNRINNNSFVNDPTTLMNNKLNRARLFGNDRTNLMSIDRLSFSHRPQNVISLGKENFHTFNISNNMILKNSNDMSSGTQEYSKNLHLNQENPVMFRNYDLNDEYWLNFE
ncbi:uncharacterized protein DDB_G0286175-like [Contarinia nasturtii]|uniref:uncharacterized protein DDB_G0286175-like n=1 Tax=Contarinia nasturtii TaxID=265458 RepID=UPI0012D46973|nr:uncharacterized protein DDB_G0286175-like [Contarinia nasturtii]